MNNWTPEAVTAEMGYRLERARAAALRKEATAGRPSWVRRMVTRFGPASGTRPVRRVTPALP